MVPLGKLQVGWVIVPIAGADGVSGCVFIGADSDGLELQSPLFTINVYAADCFRPLKAAVLPEPCRVPPPGDAVIVQFEFGKPPNCTVPVGRLQDGCVIPEMTGAGGV